MKLLLQRQLEFYHSIWSAQEEGSVCAHIHSQPPTSALSVPSLEQPQCHHGFANVVMPVPLQSQHLHIPQDQWYGQGCNHSNCLLQIISGKSHCNSRRMDWGTGIEKIDLI